MSADFGWRQCILGLALLGVLDGCAGPRTDPRLGATAAPRLAHLGPTSFKPWERWRLNRPEAAALDVYVMRDEVPRPLLVLLAGSGCTPLFFHVEREGQRLTGTRLTFALSLMQEHSGLHVATVEKVGVRSFELYSGDGMSDCSEEYERHVAKPERVRAVADALSALATEPWVSRVLLVGHSEGADVALMRDRSRPVFYLYLPGHDHSFRGPERADDARAILDRFLAWALAPVKETGVEEGLTSGP